MRVLFALAFVLVFLVQLPLVANAADCASFLTPYKASYSGSYKGWRIETDRRLQFDKEKRRWKLSVVADNWLGEIKEQSSFHWQQNEMVSQNYLYDRKVLGRHRTEKVNFNWEKKLAKASGKKSIKITLQGGELDRLNHQLLLRCALQAGEEALSYAVVDRDEVENYVYQIIGEEKLDTQLGSLDTVVVRRKRKNNDRVTTIWLAKDLDYLMVKLLQEEKKDAEAYLLYIDSMEKL